MTSKLDELLEFLAYDGEQHSMREIAQAINVPLKLCKDLTMFLAKYEFIHLDGPKVTINPQIRKLINETLSRKIALTPYP